MTTIITELRKVILTCNCILCIYIHMYLKKAVCWTSAFQIVSTNSEIMELTPCLVVIAATVTLAQTSLVTSNFIHTYAHWSFKAPQKQQCTWFNSKLRLLIYSGQNAVWNCAQQLASTLALIILSGITLPSVLRSAWSSKCWTVFLKRSA